MFVMRHVTSHLECIDNYRKHLDNKTILVSIQSDNYTVIQTLQNCKIEESKYAYYLYAQNEEQPYIKIWKHRVEYLEALVGVVILHMTDQVKINLICDEDFEFEDGND